MLIDTKEFIARMLRNSDKPFGGIQVMRSISVVLREAHIITSLSYLVTFANCHQFLTVTKTATPYHQSLPLRQRVGTGVSSVLLCSRRYSGKKNKVFVIFLKE